MTSQQDLTTPNLPTWCPGCGNFGLWAAFKNAAVAEDWNLSNTVITAGIGCHGHIINYVKLPAFESLHGRAIPVACGIKYVNHKQNVFVFTGDGDCLGEGGNHFIHACRRNHNITVILHNNNIYGLTTGQTSPTTEKGVKSKSTPDGNFDPPMNALALALSSGATFLARGFTADPVHLADLIVKANKHKGIAVIDVIQPCVSFRKELTPAYFRDNIYKLSDDYNSSDKAIAFQKIHEWGPKQIPIGIFYQEDRAAAEEEFFTDDSLPITSALPSKKDIAALIKSLS